MTYANPVGSWAKPARIDMGVDYTGAGNLFAIGDGTIVNTHNSGWPGGTFITIKLDQPIGGQQYFYYAENITPGVAVGQKVKAGQVIGHANGTFPFVELGFAAPPGTGQTMADSTGQAARGIAAGDPGTFTTGWGLAASNLIKSLGGPAGIQSPGGISGSVPSIGNVGAASPQQASLTSASGGIGGLGGIFSIPSEITGFFQEADKFVNALMWLTKPSNWIRVVAFLAGVMLLLFAIRAFMMVSEGRSPLETPQVMPI